MVRAIPSALSFAQDGLDNCTLEILREFFKKFFKSFWVPHSGFYLIGQADGIGIFNHSPGDYNVLLGFNTTDLDGF